MEWAQVRVLAAEGVSQREIGRRLGINRRTVARLALMESPPRYERAPGGSKLDRFEPLLCQLLEEWPQIKAPRATEILREFGYQGSIDVVKRRLRLLRPVAARPAQRTGYRPGQVFGSTGRRWRRAQSCSGASGGCTRLWPTCPTQVRRPPSSLSI